MSSIRSLCINIHIVAKSIQTSMFYIYSARFMEPYSCDLLVKNIYYIKWILSSMAMIKTFIFVVVLKKCRKWSGKP